MDPMESADKDPKGRWLNITILYGETLCSWVHVLSSEEFCKDFGWGRELLWNYSLATAAGYRVAVALMVADRLWVFQVDLHDCELIIAYLPFWHTYLRLSFAKERESL